jgi:tRNA 2-thiouridine synthesizing protein A
MFSHCGPFRIGRLAPYIGHIGCDQAISQRIFDNRKTAQDAGKKLGSIMTDMQSADQELDITRELCPMTFVRTRLALDRMAPGQVLLVKLRGEEPLRNVPRAAREHGHDVLSLTTDGDGLSLLLLRRGA